ncbi:hypothetical protein [Shewanella sp. Shew256]|uniref:hypothetical protein n=1 Tax=Shewanella sp. Shew256 TaxID=1969376 RepID=UPI000B4A04E9|nr:hypothetical protein [Shewanella sp. Shew256]
MFEDISSALKATLYERMSSPFISSFIISWCFFNYKIIFILFSGMETRYKFYEIELIQSQAQNLIDYPFFDGSFYPNIFFYPMLAALFYTLIFPFFEVGLTFGWMKGQQLVKSTRVRIEDVTPVSQERYSALFKKMRQKDKEYADDLASKDEQCAIDLGIEKAKVKEKQTEIDELNKSITDLEGTITSLENTIKNLSEENKKLNKKGNSGSKVNSVSKDEKLEYKILTAIINSPDFRISKSGLLQQYTGQYKLEADRVIDYLVSQGLCEQFRDNRGNEHLRLSNEGKRYFESLSG